LSTGRHRNEPRQAAAMTQRIHPADAETDSRAAIPLAILQTWQRPALPTLACSVEKTYQTASASSSDIHSTKSSSSRRGVDGNGSALIGAQPTRSSICG